MSNPKHVSLIEKQDRIIKKYRDLVDRYQAHVDRQASENAAMSEALDKIRVALREIDPL